MNLKGKRVLVVGSSSVGEQGTGTLGKALNEQLTALGVSNVQFDAKTSRGLAAPSSNQLVGTAAQKQAFAAELARVQPDLVLAVFGGNPSGTDQELRAGMSYVQATARAQGAKLLWVGPPPYLGGAQDITDQYDRIGPEVLGAAYHSSQPWTRADYGRTADFVHFTVAGGQKWAMAITTWLQTQGAPAWSWLAGAVAALGAGWYFLRRRRT